VDAETKLDRLLGIVLFFYFLLVGAAAVAYLALAFPGVDEKGVLTFPLLIGTVDRQLLLLAFAAGVAGSFLHGAQSLSSYIGNVEFKSRWAIWYLLRPCIGGILGLSVYFAFRAGLVAGASFVNPYGVVAVGLLGGWFSKTTSDKLQEVFETLFKTDEDDKRKDKLADERPIIKEVRPEPVPSGQDNLTIVGQNFLDGATFLLDGNELQTQFISESQLRVLVAVAQRPAAGTNVQVRVKNPSGSDPISSSRTVLFN
jgi:IPT/TIG domain-containing protein